MFRKAFKKCSSRLSLNSIFAYVIELSAFIYTKHKFLLKGADGIIFKAGFGKLDYAVKRIVRPE